MKVLGLDNKEYSINTSKNNIIENKSSLHLKARKLLHELFPMEVIMEEVKIPKTRLFIDFFIPTKRIAVEVHGQQHYEYNRHFFNNKLDFINSKKRDAQKIEWCVINNFDMVILPYNEESEWRNKIEFRQSETES